MILLTIPSIRLGRYDYDAIGDPSHEGFRGIQAQRRAQSCVQIIPHSSFLRALILFGGFLGKSVLPTDGEEEECPFEGRVLVIREAVKQQSRLRRNEIQIVNDDDFPAGVFAQMTPDGFVHRTLGREDVFFLQLEAKRGGGGRGMKWTKWG